MVNRIHIVIEPETRDLLDNVKSEFKKHHPEFTGMRISYNKAVIEAANFYLKN